MSIFTGVDLGLNSLWDQVFKGDEEIQSTTDQSIATTNANAAIAQNAQDNQTVINIVMISGGVIVFGFFCWIIVKIVG
jgi:hypothetical protein